MKNRCSFLVTLVLVLVGAALAAQEPGRSAGTGELVPEGVAERELIEQPIRLYEKYDAEIPPLIRDLRNCTSLAGEGSALVAYSAHVVEFGNVLEAGGWLDADGATARSAAYWRAVLVLTAMDDTAIFTRLMLLMREGLLERAEMLMLFCLYDENTQWERDRTLLKMVQADIASIHGESEKLIREGITAWDVGNRERGLELYRLALAVYPKSPWALYEISFDRMKHVLSPQQIIDGANEPYYLLIRRLDPMYQLAYQGRMTPELRTAGLAMLQKVTPCYQKLWKGEDVPVSMRTLADGLFEMGEHELALYAYKYLLFHTYTGSFEEAIVERMCRSLDALGVAETGAFLRGWLDAIAASVNPRTP